MKNLFLVALMSITVMACQTPHYHARTPTGMVLIPAGTFMMGHPEGPDAEKPVHEVELDAFYMDAHEVTI